MFQNGGQVSVFSSSHFDFGENLKGKKNPFPKEFFDKFWVIVGEHE